MSKTPFLYRFASKLNEADFVEPELHFDNKEQVNVFEDGTLSWKGVTRKSYSNAYTAGHVVPAHRSPTTNRWIKTRVVPSKTNDRRVGK